MKNLFAGKSGRCIFEVRRTWAAMSSNKGFFYALHIMPLVSLQGSPVHVLRRLGEISGYFFVPTPLKKIHS